MKQLLFQSYSFRRKSIMGNSKLFVDLLTEFPYFEQQALREDEFSTIVEMKVAKVVENIGKIIKQLWSYYGINSNNVILGSIEVIKRLEKDTKVKNKKTESLFFSGKNLDLNQVAAPRIFVQQNNFSVVYETTVLSKIENDLNFESIMMNLYSYYFIYDLKYPEVFSQVLNLFHSILFPFEECNFDKNTNMLKIIDYLKQ